MQSLHSTCVRATIVLALAFLGTIGAAAQSASLKGQITDPSGASVPEAVVTLRRAPDTQLRTKTDSQGQYSFTGLQAGTYDLTVQRAGFSSSRRPSLTIQAPSTIDIRLEVTLEAQQVTVNDANNTVGTDPTQNVGAIVITGKDLETLSDDPDQLAQDLQALAGPSAGPNGGQIFIDGFSGGQLPSKSSIREVRINQNPFSAEYDRLGFGRIEIFTKPGSDKFRGQFMTMFSDNVFNARNPFVQQNKPEFQSRFFDGSISGPITKKSSFNLNVDHRGIDENAVVNATLLDSSLTPYRFTEAIITPNSRWSINPRFDVALNDKNTLVGRYAWSKVDDLNNGIGNFSLGSRAYDSFSTNDSLQLTETAILSATMINETRLQYQRRNSNDNGDNAVPTINVLDAFTGGGSQVGIATNDTNSWEFQNITSMTRGKHAWKLGGRVRTGDISSSSPQNFGGTFTYSGVRSAPLLDASNNPLLDESGSALLGPISSIEQYRRTLVFQQQGLTLDQIRRLGGGASQFTIAGGNPLAGVRQTDVGLFALDDWRIKPNLTLSYGLRYEAQTNIGDLSNFSPRISFAWGVGGGANRTTKTVIRGGAGVFYDRVDDTLTLNARRFNGLTQQSYIVPEPNFLTVPSLDSLEANRQPQNIRELQSDIRAPYIIQTAIGVERQLPKNTSVSVNYTSSRGVHMLRTVSLPLTSSTAAQGNNVYLYESTGTLRQNQLITSVNTRFSRRLSLFGFYMLNFAKGDTDGVGTFPATSNYALEYGRTAFDTRNRFLMAGSVSAPWGVSLSPFITGSTGAPFNITSGFDANGDTQFNDRPAFATSSTDPANLRVTPWGSFNLRPGPNDTIIPRNYGRGPGQFAVNMRMSRTWGFGKAREASPNDFGGFGPGGPGGGGGDRGPRGGGGGGGGPMMMGGGGGPRGGGGGGPMGFGGGSTGKRFNITLSVSARNLLNNVNLSTPVGNLSSNSFGQSLSLGGGFGPGGPGGGGASAASNRRLDLSLRFSF